MVSTFRLLRSAAIGSLVLVWAPAAGVAQIGPRDAAPVAASPTGSLQGEVRDESGAPVAGAVISAFGADTVLAVTDRNGRFEMNALAPGFYAVRAHRGGFVSPRPYRVEILPQARSVRALTLRRSDPAYSVMAAGLGASVQDVDSIAVPETDADRAPDHDVDAHTETAWRLRHARRGVLKDSGLVADADHEDAFRPIELLSRAVGSPARFATSYLADTPFSAQVNFLAASSAQGPKRLFSSDVLSQGITHVSVSAPVATYGDWTMRGALTQADISTWFVAGSYAARPEAQHQYRAGVSYATQRYDGGNPLALREVADGSRNVGAMYAFNRVTVAPALAVTYGARYERYDYLERRGLFSPKLDLTLTPSHAFRISASLSQSSLAPGAEEFLPPGDNGLWLPPQRTFSTIEPGRPFEAERVTHVALNVERDFGPSTLSVGAFQQDVADQLVALFGTDIPGRPAASLGHYFVGSAGDVHAVGCAAQFRTVVASRLRGSVTYSLAQATLTPSGDHTYLLLLAPSALRRDGEQVHDLATSLEADLRETATRVLLLFRASNGFARLGAAGQPAEGPGFDSRFDLQVRQSLPFMSFYGARLEMLMSLSNFYRDAAPEQSLYDELLVVQPPKQFVGGVTLLF